MLRRWAFHRRRITTFYNYVSTKVDVDSAVRDAYEGVLSKVKETQGSKMAMVILLTNLHPVDGKNIDLSFVRPGKKTPRYFTFCRHLSLILIFAMETCNRYPCDRKLRLILFTYFIVIPT
jgi:hypothetical protein